MKTAKKVIIILSVVLVVAGLIVATVSFAMVDFDIKKLSSVAYTTESYQIDEPFKKIDIDRTSAQINFEISDTSYCYVECYGVEQAQSDVRVENETLKIHRSQYKDGYKKFGVFFEEETVTVYLPLNKYKELDINVYTGYIKIPQRLSFDDIKITTETAAVDFLSSDSGEVKIETVSGEVYVGNAKADKLEIQTQIAAITVDGTQVKDELEIETTTGEVTLENVDCDELEIDAEIGETYLTRVTATDKFSLYSAGGDITLNDCDAKEIKARTTTGDFTASLLSDKTYSVQTRTGEVDIPETSRGGKCQVETGSGDVRISVSK